MFTLFRHSAKKTLVCSSFILSTMISLPLDALARSGDAYGTPSLIITSDPLPAHLQEKLYNKPVRVQSIRPADISGRSYKTPQNTMVSRKVAELNSELNRIQSDVEKLSSNLRDAQKQSEAWSADYYANVATINTQLQSGTTRGNPRLVRRLSDAESKLESLANGLMRLNALSSETADIASEASFLLEEARAAYGISGAVEEDHVRLTELEDHINGTIVIIDRLLNTANDDITRATTYLSSERSNLRTLSLAVTNGDLYGKSLSNRPFSSVATPYNSASVSNASLSSSSSQMSMDAPAPMAAPALSSPRPLAKIRFDRPDVEYQQPIYAAINEALQRYPNARFDLVAVHPTEGNPAQVAIESTKARRNAEKVLRTLTQMGLPLEQIDLSYGESAEARTNEVHLFIK